MSKITVSSTQNSLGTSPLRYHWYFDEEHEAESHYSKSNVVLCVSELSHSSEIPQTVATQVQLHQVAVQDFTYQSDHLAYNHPISLVPIDGSALDRFVDISQGVMIDQFMKYLKLVGTQEGKAREVYVNYGGDCKGYAFLFAYYNSKKAGQEFIDILTYISKWNGQLNSLATNFGMSTILQHKYKSGKDLFEQTINDSTWFAHTKTSKVCNYKYAQNDRLEQYEIAKDNKNALEQIYKFLDVQSNQLNKYLLPDILNTSAK